MVSLSRIEALLSLGRHQEAEEMILLALASEPNNESLFCLLARARLAQNKPKGAEEAARKAIGAAPEDIEPRILLVLALLNRRRLQAASQAITEAIALEPEESFCYGLKARILAEQGNQMAALNAAETGLALDPEEETCHFYRSLILSSLGRHQEANEASLELLRDGADEGDNHNARGWILLQAGDGDGAERHFLQALRIDASDEHAREGLTQALKSKNFFVGWLMRISLQLGGLDWNVILAGTMILIGVSHLFKQLQNPTWVQLLGFALTLFLILIAALWTIHGPLGSLALWTSRTGRLAQSDSEKRALKLALFPIIGGVILFGIWLGQGAQGAPLAGFCWLATAGLLFAVLNESSSGLRRWLYLLPCLGLLTALWVTFGAPLLLAAKGAEISAPVGLRRSEIDPNQQAALSLRNQVLVFPTLAVLGVLTFFGDLATWLRSWLVDD